MFSIKIAVMRPYTWKRDYLMDVHNYESYKILFNTFKNYNYIDFSILESP